MQPLPSVVAYVRPSLEMRRPYHGALLPRGRKMRLFKGGKPVRQREVILAAAGRKV